MGNRKKKGESGEVTRYVTRNIAVKKLQLSLRDFRKLCILKGVYPREPRNRKKVQKGASQIKTLYYLKDIQFLMHEPLIRKFREQRTCLTKIRKAYAKNETAKGGSLFNKRPFYRLDHIVRERYPTFTDALRDLDDPLTLCNLFAKLPRIMSLKYGILEMSRRVTTEFMLYVIEARALRKVFISIKGYYYQAEIMGQTVTWITPHPFTPQNSTHVDFTIMKTFLEFYLSLLGFVNFRLFTSLNFHYPPKLPGAIRSAWSTLQADADERDIKEISAQRIASLNVPLQRNKVEEPDPEAAIDTHLLEEDGQHEDQLKEAQEEDCKKKRQQSLFVGFKFFLNRETNYESLTFVIRSCGGEVSWDKLTNSGSTYTEDDESITHQIVDRPKFTQKYMSRYYVQPQWVYDTVNARLLLPVQDYFLGARLPPHLSPFDLEHELYVPPEKKQLLARQSGDIPEEEIQNPEEETDSELEEEPKPPKPSAKQKAIAKMKRKRERAMLKAKEEEEEAAEEARKKAAGILNEDEGSEMMEGNEIKEGNEMKEHEEASTKNKVDGKDATTEEAGEASKESEEGKDQKKRKVKEMEPVEMEVTKGKLFRIRGEKAQQQEREERRLNVMMIPKKHKKIYDILRRKEKRQEKRAAFLTYKRASIDYKNKIEKRATKKQQQEKEIAKGKGKK